MILICNKCATPHNVEVKNFDEVGRDETRIHGTEIAYSGGTYHKCNCETMLTFAFDLWEYPKGEINYTENRSNNCIIKEDLISLFSLGFLLGKREKDHIKKI